MVPGNLYLNRNSKKRSEMITELAKIKCRSVCHFLRPLNSLSVKPSETNEERSPYDLGYGN